MRRSLLALAVGVAFASAASAQKVTVGPDPNAGAIPKNLFGFGLMSWQSILIPRAPLGSGMWTYLRLRFWFDGSIVGNDNYFTDLSFGAGDPNNLPNQKRLDQNTHGWVQLIVKNPALVSGQTFWLMLQSDWYQHFKDACDSDPTCRYGDVDARVQVIDPDTYADGAYYCGRLSVPCGDGGHDMRFQADFHTTPEPVTMVLLGTGLAGIGVVVRRRKRRTDSAD